jgi:hypothetical protein
LETLHQVRSVLASIEDEDLWVAPLVHPWESLYHGTRLVVSRPHCRTGDPLRVIYSTEA